MATWRSLHGPYETVYFGQVHHPGRLAASDFTVCNKLGTSAIRCGDGSLLATSTIRCSTTATSYPRTDATAFDETVSVSPMVTASGAVIDALQTNSWLSTQESRSVGLGFMVARGVGDNAPATIHRRLIVGEIRQYAIGAVGPKVDYVLNGDSGSPPIRLCLLRNEYAKLRPLVLTLYDSLAYDESLLAVVTDESGRLTIQGDAESSNIAADRFWRVYARSTSSSSSVRLTAALQPLF